MRAIRTEMNFCRRCGTKLTHNQGPRYTCEQGHIIFENASPAVAVVLVNDKKEVLILVRAVEPGKGLWDVPGGFCDGAESLEAAAKREVAEETGLLPEDYSSLEYVMSDVDGYDYEGETMAVLDGVFTARTLSSKEPKAADDAAAALWVPLDSLGLDRIAFESVREGLRQVIKKLT